MFMDKQDKAYQDAVLVLITAVGYWLVHIVAAWNKPETAMHHAGEQLKAMQSKPPGQIEQI